MREANQPCEGARGRLPEPPQIGCSLGVSSLGVSSLGVSSLGVSSLGVSSLGVSSLRGGSHCTVMLISTQRRLNLFLT